MRIAKRQIQEALTELAKAPTSISVDDGAIIFLMANPSVMRLIESGLSMEQVVDVTTIAVGSLVTGIKIGLEQPSFGRDVLTPERKWDA